MPASPEPDGAHVEIRPIVIVVQSFPARPSALPDVRDFVRRQLAATPVSDEDVRALGDRVAEVLLNAAGLAGAILVSLRIFRTAAEVDVLFAPDDEQPAERHPLSPSARETRTDEPGIAALPEPSRPAQSPAVQPPAVQSFAVWLSGRLRAEGLTLEAAARKLGVSTKTVSRWANGTTEPRLRDLSRIRDVFGEPSFH